MRNLYISKSKQKKYVCLQRQHEGIYVSVIGMELKEELECSQRQEAMETVNHSNAYRGWKINRIITGNQGECEP